MQQSQEKTYKQTSYWLAHREPAYLMYLKDVAMRIDPTQLHLKSSIDSYIAHATALESTLFDIEIGRQHNSQTKLKQFEEETAKIDKELQDLVGKILKLKLALTKQLRQKEQLQIIALHYLSTIYNDLVAHINTVLASETGKRTLGTASRLIPYDTSQKIQLKVLFTTLQRNKDIIQQCIQQLQSRQQQIQINKETITQNIVKFFEKGGKRLFQTAKKHFEANTHSIAKIASLQAQIQELDEQIHKLQQIQNRKIANIGLYSAALESKDKDHLRLSRTTTLHSDDSQNNVNVVYEPMNNPKIVFSHEKPNRFLWAILALWFLVLLGTAVNFAYY